MVSTVLHIRVETETFVEFKRRAAELRIDGNDIIRDCVAAFAGNGSTVTITPGRYSKEIATTPAQPE